MKITPELKRRFEILSIEHEGICAVPALLHEPEPPAISVAAISTTGDSTAHIEPENAVLLQQAEQALAIVRRWARSWPDRLRGLFADQRGVRFFVDPAPRARNSSPAVLAAMGLSHIAREIRDVLVCDLNLPIFLRELPFACAAGLDDTGDRLESPSVSRLWAALSGDKEILLTHDQDVWFQEMPGLVLRKEAVLKPVSRPADLFDEVFKYFCNVIRTEAVLPVQRHFEQQIDALVDLDAETEQARFDAMPAEQRERKLNDEYTVLELQAALLEKRLDETRRGKQEGHELPSIESIAEELISIEEDYLEERARQKINAVQRPSWLHVNVSVTPEDTQKRELIKRLFRAVALHVHPDTGERQTWFTFFMKNRKNVQVLRALEGALVPWVDSGMGETAAETLANHLDRLFYLKESRLDLARLVRERSEQKELLQLTATGAREPEWQRGLRVLRARIDGAWAALRFEMYGRTTE